MLEVIEKLLVLQDRDRKIQRAKIELAHVGPEREALKVRLSQTQAALDASKLKEKKIESDRKELELEVEAKKQQIEKYSLQQFQTKKNDEYRALAHEIEHCKSAIAQLEDQQLELMEQAETAHGEAVQASNASQEAKELVDKMAADLDQKEQALKTQLDELEANYERLAEGIDEGVLGRYQRLRKSKGESVVVGIERSVCGGCHMKLPTHVVVACQGQQEIVSCTNCGRILYYAPHMDLAATP